MRTAREDSRDRLLLSISEALVELLGANVDWGARKQIASNLTECNKDLLVTSGIRHGRPSGWRDCINQ